MNKLKWYDWVPFIGIFTALDEALSSCYKVIGEISREATWVKEGDEFDKDEIYLSGIGSNWNDETPLSGKSIAFIKGPCGHRH